VKRADEGARHGEVAHLKIASQARAAMYLKLLEGLLKDFEGRESFSELRRC
jgi:hypothetical protein